MVRTALIGFGCAAVAAAASADVPAIGADAVVAAPSFFYKYLGSPGIELQYEEYMTEAGELRSGVAGTKLTSSGPLLLLGAGVTRCGGILPDEMPFNIVQKLARLIPGVDRILPDLSDNDERKSYQDTWYGTDVKASLPPWLRSRSQVIDANTDDDDDVDDPPTVRVTKSGKDALL